MNPSLKRNQISHTVDLEARMLSRSRLKQLGRVVGVRDVNLLSAVTDIKPA